MDFNLSCDLLCVKVPFTKKCLKRSYYREALKYHPDKNKEIGATERFKDIQNSFELLSKYLDENNNVKSGEGVYIDDKTSFMGLLKKRLNIDSDLFSLLTDNLSNKLNIDMYKSILDRIDNETVYEVLNYCDTYKDTLGIDIDILNKLKRILEEKRKKDEVIILNPNVDNILNMDVYCLRLEEDDVEIYVPLWQEEVIFNIKEKTYIIRNDLDLPENMLLDENNDLHIKIDISLDTNIDTPFIYKMCEKVFEINYGELKIKHYQTYRIKGRGIPRINPRNILDISNISDVVFHINLII